MKTNRLFSKALVKIVKLTIRRRLFLVVVR